MSNVELSSILIALIAVVCMFVVINESGKQIAKYKGDNRKLNGENRYLRYELKNSNNDCTHYKSIINMYKKEKLNKPINEMSVDMIAMQLQSHPDIKTFVISANDKNYNFNIGGGK